jgi:two-component system, sporulation sensor kinase D
LGTPLSSLMAWNEILRSQGIDDAITTEIDKDIIRLNTITDRFSKIGSEAALEPHNVVKIIEHSMDYLSHRVLMSLN